VSSISPGDGLEDAYPPEAYAPNGELWWRLTTWPGKNQKFGAERKIAAWLAFNKRVGETFTFREIREALGREVANTDEHLQRRLRQLRKDGWEIPSGKYDPNVGASGYRLDKMGWHPAQGARPRDESKVSEADRRKVFERDGNRCVLCGVGAGEPYPDEPTRRAVLTVGHRRPGAFQGSGSLSNLQAECARCNEPARAGTAAVEEYTAVEYAVRELPTRDKRSLLEWLREGRRIPSRLDVVHDRVRRLSHDERELLLAELDKTVGSQPGQ
jgi:hypothetical protein